MRFLIMLSTLVTIAFSGCVVLPIPHTTQRSPKITGRTLDSRTHRPIADAKVQLANLPNIAAVTDSNGVFFINPTHLFHVIWYANPSFVMHFPYADVSNYWSGSLHITADGYKPLSFLAANKDWPPPSERKSTKVGDIFLQPQRR